MTCLSSEALARIRYRDLLVLEERDAEIARLKDALRVIKDYSYFIATEDGVYCKFCNTLDSVHTEPREHYDWCPKAIAQKALREGEK